MTTMTATAIRSKMKSGFQGRWKCERIKGLALAFKPRGAIWTWKGRVEGVPRTITLGGYQEGTFGLTEARARAAEINEDAACGVNVYDKWGAGKAAAEATALAEARRGILTCQEAFDLYKVEYLPDNKPRTQHEKLSYWERLWQPVIGHKLLTEITYHDLAAVTDSFRATGKMATANNVGACIKHFFGWCETEEARTGLKDTPARKIKVRKRKPRTRSLSKAEIRWFFEALGEVDMHVTVRRFYLAILLTGHRRNELRLLTGSEFERDPAPVLNFPAVRMKNNLAHLTPLGPRAVKLIQDQMRSHNYRFVFTCFTPEVAVKAIATRQLAIALDKLNFVMQAKAEKAGHPYSRWTAHDLRRTFSTHANGILDENGKPVLAENDIERTLAHTIGGIKGVYNLHQYFAEKARVYRVWEEELRRIVGDELFERY